jgi:hypothetical protein
VWKPSDKVVGNIIVDGTTWGLGLNLKYHKYDGHWLDFHAVFACVRINLMFTIQDGGPLA